MHQCPTCGKQLDESIRFCPDDGTPLTDTAAATSARTPAGGRTAPPDLELPLVVGQRYKLVEYRGGGGMAKVYRALDLTLEREVAVKLINPHLRSEPEFDARFQREARIVSQLSDPHIVVVHDFGIDLAHGPFLVMEYLKGQSLREHLQSHGPLPYKAAVQLSGQMLLALIHAHEKGIVHRDIKPDNVFLLSQSGVRLHVRVLDFGIARIYREGGAAGCEPLTHPGAVLGTPRYMSPEQLAGQAVDARSDLYTAAMVIHESMTLQLPYVGGQKLCELCPEAPQALEDLLDQCLKPNPNERPHSAVELYVRLQELGKASGILLLQPGALDRLIATRHRSEPTSAYVPSASEPVQRRRWVIRGAALLALLGLAMLAIWLIVKWRTPAPIPSEESLVGLKIGASLSATQPGLQEIGAARLMEIANPWADKRGKRPAALGHVLRPADVGLEENAAIPINVAATGDDHVWVLFLPDAKQADRPKLLQAVVVRAPHRGATARGLRINDSVAQLFRLYPEPATEVHDIEPERQPGQAGRPPYIEVRRHDDLGIGFEVQAGKVVAITLYPPKAP